MFASLLGSFGSMGILTYIKIGVIVVIAAAIGSLYWYGQHEAGLVHVRDQQIGAQAQILADDKANIDALTTANQNWANAFEKYKQDAQNQATAYQIALALKEKINAKLSAIEAQLRTNPRAAAVALNALNDQLVCLLDRSAGGSRDDCPASAAVAPGSAAPVKP